MQNAAARLLTRNWEDAAHLTSPNTFALVSSELLPRIEDPADCLSGKERQAPTAPELPSGFLQLAFVSVKPRVEVSGEPRRMRHHF